MITVGGPNVTLDVGSPEQVEIHATVMTRDGIRFAAFTVLDEAMNYWETKLLPRIAT